MSFSAFRINTNRIKPRPNRSAQVRLVGRSQAAIKRESRGLCRNRVDGTGLRAQPGAVRLWHCQAHYGTPAALRDDVTAHCAPFPAVASARFLDIVMFRGLPTYRVTLVDGEGATSTAYYLVRRLADGSL